jgi:hypothetical protein
MLKDFTRDLDNIGRRSGGMFTGFRTPAGIAA